MAKCQIMRKLSHLLYLRVLGSIPRSEDILVSLNSHSILLYHTLDLEGSVVKSKSNLEWDFNT